MVVGELHAWEVPVVAIKAIKDMEKLNLNQAHNFRTGTEGSHHPEVLPGMCIQTPAETAFRMT